MLTIQIRPRVCVCITEVHSGTHPTIKKQAFPEKSKHIRYFRKRSSTLDA